MSYSIWFAGKNAGHLSFASHGLARCTTVLDFFAVLFFHCRHCSAFDVIFVGYEFENVVGTGFYALAAAVALVSVYYDEVVA